MATIKVKQAIVKGNDSGYAIIEEENFDPSIHEKYEDTQSSPKSLDEMSYQELKAFLTANNVEHAANIKKDEALALAKAVEVKE